MDVDNGYVHGVFASFYPTSDGSETVKVSALKWYACIMLKSRTMSMELRLIRQQMQESPPPPPAGTTVREWFAGLALMNPALMRDLNPAERVTEAIRLADELVRALAVPRTPSQESMAAPSTEEALARAWNGMAAAMGAPETIKDDDRRERQTIRPGKRRTSAQYDAAPAIEHFKRASDMLLEAVRPGAYSSFHSDTEE